MDQKFYNNMEESFKELKTRMYTDKLVFLLHNKLQKRKYDT